MGFYKDQGKEILTVTRTGIMDVLSANRFEQDALANELQEYLRVSADKASQAIGA